jgi:hypothetical protein
MRSTTTDPSRVDAGVCGQQYMPYVEPAELDYLPALLAAQPRQHDAAADQRGRSAHGAQ